MGTFKRIQLKRYTYFQQEQYKPVLDADGQPVVNPDTGDAEMTLTEKAEYYFGNYFPVEVEPTNYTKGLYVIDYDMTLPGKFKLWRADDHWLDLDGTKKMRGGIQAASDFYWQNNKFGLHMNNSDIIGAHCIYFQDVVDSHNEGINFMRNNGNYDNVAALDGELYFTINVPKNNTTVRLQHKVLTANNYNTFSPKLDGTGATGNWNINAASTKKLDHNVTINLTDTDNKNGVKGSITTDFSSGTVNIVTEISPLDASKITSGIIDIERLPQGVLERLVPVANKAARFALTKAQVQNGDTVKQIDTKEMWYVSDDTQLNSDAGYEVYTAGSASSVPWTGVEGKPTQITLIGNVTGSVALGAGVLSFGTTISPNVVDNTKLSDMPVSTIKGRQGSAGDPQDLNPTQIRAILNVDDGANNYTHPAYTERAAGFYKVTVDALGHVSGVSAVTNTDIMGLHTSHVSSAAGFYKVTVDNKGHVSNVNDVTKADITALGIPAQDTVYTHPSYTAKAAGFYKVTVDALGHLSGVTNVTKADITALGIPGSDTTYTHPTYTERAAGFYKVTVDALGHLSGVTNVTKADITALGIPGSDTTYTHPAYTAKAAGFYKVTVDALGHVSGTTNVAKADITALGIPGSDTTYEDFTRSVSGLVPAPGGSSTNRYMREDGTWVVPPDTNTTYGLSTTSANGLLRQLNGSTTQFMRGDGTWATPDTTYTHPAYTAKAAGFYKVTVDALGHVSGTTNVTKADITALGIPGSDTTYGLATTSASGLLRQLNGSTSNFLRGDGTWATVPVPSPPDLSNYVTLNGVQTITGKKTFSDGILIDNMGIHNVANAFRLQNMTGATSYITLKPDGQSTFDGSIFVAGGGFGSDFRFKDKIREIDTSKSSKIKLYQFYNLRAKMQSGGVIAQELEKLYPDAVMTDMTSDDKYKYVDYNYVFSILHAEHRKEIENLWKEVQEKSMYDLDKLSIRKLFKLILLKILNFE